MGTIKTPPKAIFICAVMFIDDDTYRQAGIKLLEKFGAIADRSEIFDFTFSDYYEEELGPGLKKRFVSFRTPFAMERLAAAKRTSNSIEEIMGRIRDGRIIRRVNIDPGYVTPDKVVLASTKDNSHRIYLSDGIFAEVTLRYHKEAFEPLPWTYPDYNTELSKAFFRSIRDKLKTR